MVKIKRTVYGKEMACHPAETLADPCIIRDCIYPTLLDVSQAMIMKSAAMKYAQTTPEQRGQLDQDRFYEGWIEDLAVATASDYCQNALVVAKHMTGILNGTSIEREGIILPTSMVFYQALELIPKELWSEIRLEYRDKVYSFAGFGEHVCEDCGSKDCAYSIPAVVLYQAPLSIEHIDSLTGSAEGIKELIPSMMRNGMKAYSTNLGDGMMMFQGIIPHGDDDE